MTTVQALGTLIDELKNPEKCYRAIGEFHICKRLGEVLNGLMDGPQVLGNNLMAIERTILVLGD